MPYRRTRRSLAGSNHLFSALDCGNQDQVQYQHDGWAAKNLDCCTGGMPIPVCYICDAWSGILSITDSLASALGERNPSAAGEYPAPEIR